LPLAYLGRRNHLGGDSSNQTVKESCRNGSKRLQGLYKEETASQDMRGDTANEGGVPGVGK